MTDNTITLAEAKAKYYELEEQHKELGKELEAARLVFVSMAQVAEAAKEAKRREIGGAELARWAAALARGAEQADRLHSPGYIQRGPRVPMR